MQKTNCRQAMIAGDANSPVVWIKANESPEKPEIVYSYPAHAVLLIAWTLSANEAAQKCKCMPLSQSICVNGRHVQSPVEVSGIG